jgi:molecular chaperone HtpG
MPMMVVMPEFMRRMKEMSASGGGGFMGMGDFPDHYDVVVNGNHPLAGKILKAEEPADREQLVLQAKDLALLQQGLLTGERLTAFVNRSLDRLV